MKDRKACKIVEIQPHIRRYLNLEGYLVLEDSWITEFNETLFDEDGNEFLVMEFKEAVIYELTSPVTPPLPNISCWGLVNHSAVLLNDGFFKVGDKLYTEGIN